MLCHHFLSGINFDSKCRKSFSNYKLETQKKYTYKTLSSDSQAKTNFIINNYLFFLVVLGFASVFNIRTFVKNKFRVVNYKLGKFMVKL